MAQGDNISGIILHVANATEDIQPPVGQVWLITRIFHDFSGKSVDLTLIDDVRGVSLNVENIPINTEIRLFLSNNYFLRITGAYGSTTAGYFQWSGVQFK